MLFSVVLLNFFSIIFISCACTKVYFSKFVAFVWNVLFRFRNVVLFRRLGKTCGSEVEGGRHRGTVLERQSVREVINQTLVLWVFLCVCVCWTWQYVRQVKQQASCFICYTLFISRQRSGFIDRHFKFYPQQRDWNHLLKAVMTIFTLTKWKLCDSLRSSSLDQLIV